MAHSVVQDIAERLSRINKALTTGHAIHKEDLSVLREGYATPYSDKELALGYSESALPNEEDQYGGIPFVVTVLDEDRDGDIVIPEGYRGESYAKNPVWFFGHQQWEIPIGTSRDPKGRIAVSVFPDRVKSTWYCDHDDEDADFIYGKVKRGILNATSIAFVPLEAVRRDHIEVQEHKARTHQPPGMPPGWRFDVWDHTETSIVGVPSNAGAIRDSLDSEKSFITPRLQKGLRAYAASAKGCWGGWCPPLDNRTSDSISVSRGIEKDVSKDTDKGIAKGRRGGASPVAAGTTGLWEGKRSTSVSPSKSSSVISAKSRSVTSLGKNPILSNRDKLAVPTKVSTKAGTQADMESTAPRPSINPPPGTRPVGVTNLPPGTRSSRNASAINRLSRQGTVNTHKDAADMRVEERDGLYYVVDPDIDHVDGPYETEEEARHHIEFMVGEEATSPSKRPIPANRKDANANTKAEQPSSKISPDKACKILHDGGYHTADGKWHDLTEAQRGMFGASCSKKSLNNPSSDCYQRGVNDALNAQKMGQSLKILYINTKSNSGDSKLKPCYVSGWNSIANKSINRIKNTSTVKDANPADQTVSKRRRIKPIDYRNPQALRDNVVATLQRYNILPRIAFEGMRLRITVRDQDWDKAFEVIDDNFDNVSTSLGDIMVGEKDADSIEKVSTDNIKDKSLLESSGVAGGYTVGGMTDPGRIQSDIGSGDALEDIHAEAFTACPECHGTCRTSDGEECPECNGIGMVEKANTMTSTTYRVRIGKKGWLSKAKGSNPEDDRDEFTTDEDDAREFEDQGEAATKAEDVGGEVEENVGYMPVEGEGEEEGVGEESSETPQEESEEQLEEQGEEQEVPFEPKHSARVMAHTYAHMKALHDYLSKELARMDNPDARVSMEDHIAKYVQPAMEHIKELVGKHHNDHDLDEMVKAIEGDTGGVEGDQNLEGEAGMVNEGHVPPEGVGVEGEGVEGEIGGEEEKIGAGDLGMSDIEATGTSRNDDVLSGLQREEPGRPFVHETSDDTGEQPMSGPRDRDTDTEEILERYQTRDGKWMTRKAGLIKRTKNGKAFFIREKGILNPGDREEEDAENLKGILNPGDREEVDAEELKGILNPGDREEIDAEELKGFVKDACGYMKDMEEDTDIPRRHKAPLRYHTKRLASVHKALTDMGKFQHSGGKGKPLTDEGTAGNKRAMTNMGERQGKNPPATQGRGNPGSTKSNSPARNGTPAKSVSTNGDNNHTNTTNGSNGRHVSSAVEEAANRLISRFEQTTGIRLSE